MATPDSANSPPDWLTQVDEVLCTSCEYNLRGLTGNRCPECGFTFQWKELLEGGKNRHKYLFEYGKGRNFKSFWKTYWRTCRPRRFWKDLSPAQPVVRWRLLLYWIIATGLVSMSLLGPKIDEISSFALRNYQIRYGSLPTRRGAMPPLTGWTYMTPGTAFGGSFPLPWEFEFWRTVWKQWDVASRYYLYGYKPSGAGFLLIFAMWPWMTVLSLLVFRYSMRQAKILRVHVIRAAIYSTDFGLLFLVFFATLYVADLRMSQGPFLLLPGLICGLVTSYRLSIAFRRYLRVHLPLATVLASQIISVLATAVVVAQVADFSRWM